MRQLVVFLSLAIIILIAPIAGAPQTASATQSAAALYAVRWGGSNIQENYVTAAMPLPTLSTPTGFTAVDRMFTSSDGSRLFLAGPSSNSGVQTAIVEEDRTSKDTVSVVGSAITAPGSASYMNAISPDGKHLYVQQAGYGSNKAVSIIDINQTGISLDSGSISIGQLIIALGVSPDSSKLYVEASSDPYRATAYVNVYSTSSPYSQIGSSISVGSQQGTELQGLAVEPDNGYVWVVNPGDGTCGSQNVGHTVSIIDTSGGVYTLDLGTTGTVPQSITIRPDGHYAYIGDACSTGGNVTVVDTTTSPHPTVLKNIALGNTNNPGVLSLAVAPDGTFVYVGESLSDTNQKYVAVIDASTNALTASPLPISAFAPQWLTVAPFPATFGVGNDYPATMTGPVPPCPVGGTCIMGSAPTFPSSYLDIWSEYSRQCVSFTAWRMYRDGHTGDQPTSAGGYGDGSTWRTAAVSHGITVDHSAAVGTVVAWDASQTIYPVGGSSFGADASHGHAAYVTSVPGDGTIWIEDYNEAGTGVYKLAHLDHLSTYWYIHF